MPGFLGVSLWMFSFRYQPQRLWKSQHPPPHIQIDLRHISKYFCVFVCALVAHIVLFLFIFIQIPLTQFLYHLCPNKMDNAENSISESETARSKAIFWPPPFFPGTHCLQLRSLFKVNLLHSWEVGWWTVESYLQRKLLNDSPKHRRRKSPFLITMSLTLAL